MKNISEIKKVDVHHHIIPEFYRKEMMSIGIEAPGGVKFPKWNEKKSLAVMNKNNIEKAYTSVSLPGVYFGDNKKAFELARRCNEYSYELKSKYPKRFGAFASLPLPYVEGAIKEIEYSLDKLKLDGVVLLSSVENIYLGDESYKRVFEELDKRHAVVFIHSNSPKNEIDSKLTNPFYWWFIDTTKSLMSIVESGYHKKFRNIKYVVSHAGGILPAVYHQIEESLINENPYIKSELDEFRSRIYIDVAKSVGDDAFKKTFEYSSVDNVLFGSDYIWANSKKVEYWVNQVNLLENIQIEKIYNKNINNLFDRNHRSTCNEENKRTVCKSEDEIYHVHCNTKEIISILESHGVNVTGIKSENISNVKSNSYVSVDIKELWTLPISKRFSVINEVNKELGQLNANNKFKVLGMIDIYNSDHAISEIKYCLDILKLDGIMIYLDIKDTRLNSIFSDELEIFISSLEVPVVFHPVYSQKAPIINPNYLDSVYMIAKLFYLNKLKIFDNKNIILTHTSGVHNFLDENIGMLYYLQLEKWNILGFMIDQFIKKKPLGLEIIRNIRYSD